METSDPDRQPVKDASVLVTDLPTLRFAIAAFDTWAGTQKALRALDAGGKALNNISYLAEQRVLGDALTSDGRQITAPVGRERWRDWLLGRSRLLIASPGGLPREPPR